MKLESAQVVYGKYLVYEVVRCVDFFGMSFIVCTSNGKRHTGFKRLEEAVAWARKHAQVA